MTQSLKFRPNVIRNNKHKTLTVRFTALKQKRNLMCQTKRLKSTTYQARMLDKTIIIEVIKIQAGNENKLGPLKFISFLLLIGNFSCFK